MSILEMLMPTNRIDIHYDSIQLLVSDDPQERCAGLV